VMALRTRFDYYKLTTGINTRKLCAVSRLVSSITGMTVQRNKAIVGQNAFAHEAGIHQHGMLMERTTYEIMRPEDVGFTGSNLVLGKHSGRHAFRDRIAQLGHDLDEKTFEKVFEDFIVLCDKKKNVYDADILALIENRNQEAPDRWKLTNFHTSAGTGAIPTATIELVEEGNPPVRDAAIGDGPIDAVFNALDRVTGISPRLQNYQVRSLTVGKEAQGEVLVEIVHNNHVFHGKAASTDIIEASAQAYLKALNKAGANRHTEKPLHAQHGSA
jgi:2-isopropylmalate synthase